MAASLFGLVRLGASWESTRTLQSSLDPFYTAPDPIPSELGTVIRSEPMDIDVPGGSAQRILYVSERPDGTPAVSGAMVFIPDSPAPSEGRPVVAWQHGTLGMGDACVPSRSTNPTADMFTFLGPMMEQGWVITATDYVGLGTTGPNQYLIAQSEVRDVVNAVRAARNIPEAAAGSRYATFGHSQGGHASIWAGHLGAQYAPELELVGVAAAAPALNLSEIASAQWDTAVGWVIGSDLVESWPTYYPNLLFSTAQARESFFATYLAHFKYKRVGIAYPNAEDAFTEQFYELGVTEYAGTPVFLAREDPDGWIWR